MDKLQAEAARRTLVKFEEREAYKQALEQIVDLPHGDNEWGCECRQCDFAKQIAMDVLDDRPNRRRVCEA